MDMTPDVKDWMKGLVTEIVNAPSCCAELKPVAEEWLKKCDTDELMVVTKKLLDELKLDVNTIDQTIAFTESDAAKDMFGAEKAAEMKKQFEKAKADGEEYCICPACKPGAVLLIHEEFLLK